MVSEIGQQRRLWKAGLAAMPHAAKARRAGSAADDCPPTGCQAEQPACRRAVVLIDFTEQNFVWFISDLCDIHNPRVLDHLILETEPSPFGDALRRASSSIKLDGRSRRAFAKLSRMTMVANSVAARGWGMPSRLIASVASANQ